MLCFSVGQTCCKTYNILSDSQLNTVLFVHGYIIIMLHRLLVLVSLFVVLVHCTFNPCVKYESCFDCSTDPYCGWCEFDDICFPGSFDGPDQPYSCFVNNSYSWDYMNCPMNTCLDNGDTCLSCITYDSNVQDGLSCGWCSVSELCMPGTPYGPTHGFQCINNTRTIIRSEDQVEQQEDWFYTTCSSSVDKIHW